MAVLIDENTRVVVQGITGREGSFHARACKAYGTNVVAGVTPGKGGQLFDDAIPVFDSVEEAVEQTGRQPVADLCSPSLCSRRHRRGG